MFIPDFRCPLLVLLEQRITALCFGDPWDLIPEAGGEPVFCRFRLTPGFPPAFGSFGDPGLFAGDGLAPGVNAPVRLAPGPGACLRFASCVGSAGGFSPWSGACHGLAPGTNAVHRLAAGLLPDGSAAITPRPREMENNAHRSPPPLCFRRRRATGIRAIAAIITPRRRVVPKGVLFVPKPVGATAV